MGVILWDLPDWKYLSFALLVISPLSKAVATHVRRTSCIVCFMSSHWARFDRVSFDESSWASCGSLSAIGWKYTHNIIVTSNERHGVTGNWPIIQRDNNRWNTKAPHYWPFCEGGFVTQRASDAESVFMSCRLQYYVLSANIEKTL